MPHARELSLRARWAAAPGHRRQDHVCLAVRLAADPSRYSPARMPKLRRLPEAADVATHLRRWLAALRSDPPPEATMKPIDRCCGACVAASAWQADRRALAQAIGDHTLGCFNP